MPTIKGSKRYPETHTCVMCGFEKKRIAFDKIKGLYLDISPICKHCENRVYGVKHIQFHYDVSQEDYRQTFELLESIGYDTKGDIHQQFCDKYGLEYRERRPDFYDTKTDMSN